MAHGQTSYRLIYVSQNALCGTAAEMETEVDRILAVSRRNNARDGVTGALLFNDNCFAQVLEGDSDTIHTVFERIQIDPRHRDTVVLSCAQAPREFGEWSMAYAGSVRDGTARYQQLALPGAAEEASGQVLNLLRGVLLRQTAA